MNFADLPEDAQSALVRNALAALLSKKPDRRELLALARMAFDAADEIEVEAIERGAWAPSTGPVCAA